MNLVLLREGDAWLSDNVVTLTDHRADHILRHLGASLGDAVRVGQLGGKVGTGRLEAIDQGHVTLSVQLEADPPRAITSTLSWRCPGRKCCDASCAPWRSLAWRTCT